MHPNVSKIKVVGTLKTNLFVLELVQEDGVRDIYNAVEGIIALGWEKLEEEEEIPERRRVFNFGDTKESVDEQLYEYDLTLKYKENKVTRDVE